MASYVTEVQKPLASKEYGILHAMYDSSSWKDEHVYLN